MERRHISPASELYVEICPLLTLKLTGHISPVCGLCVGICPLLTL